MKYIAPWEGSFDHRPYWDYLASARHLMPPHIFAFASNLENHDLTSPNSLHDSWLESWTIREPNGTGSRSHRSIEIDARLLGSRWDRHICLTYKNVQRYEFSNPGDTGQFPNRENKGHGDILVHEMRLEREGVFAHELIFSEGVSFVVEFLDFEHRIEML